MLTLSKEFISDPDQYNPLYYGSYTSTAMIDPFKRKTAAERLREEAENIIKDANIQRQNKLDAAEKLDRQKKCALLIRKILKEME